MGNAYTTQRVVYFASQSPLKSDFDTGNAGEWWLQRPKKEGGKVMTSALSPNLKRNLLYDCLFQQEQNIYFSI